MYDQFKNVDSYLVSYLDFRQAEIGVIVSDRQGQRVLSTFSRQLIERNLAKV
jgi:hypothetical protein